MKKKWVVVDEYNHKVIVCKSAEDSISILHSTIKNELANIKANLFDFESIVEVVENEWSGWIRLDGKTYVMDYKFWRTLAE